MKKMRKAARILGLTVLLSVLLLTAVACGRKSTPAASTDGKTSILVFNEWVGSHAFTAYFNQRLDVFKTANPDVAVSIEEIAGTGSANMDDKLKVMISAGELPDVFYTNDRSIVDLAYRSGLLYDMSEFYNADADFHHDLGETTMNSWNAGKNGIYAISSSQNFFGIFYNKAHLASVGYDEFPTTWEEFYDMSDKLVAKGIAPMALCTETAFIPSLTLLAVLASQGPEGEVQANTQPNTNFMTPEFIKAAGTLQNMYRSYTTKDAIGATADSAVEKFSSGQAAMCFLGTWQLDTFRKALGEDLGMAPLPGNGVISYPDYAWFSGAKTKASAEAAYKFIRNFNNTEDQQTRLEMLGAFPDSTRIDISTVQLDPIMTGLLELREDVGYSASSPWLLFNAATISVLPQEYSALGSGVYTPEQFAKELTDVAQH